MNDEDLNEFETIARECTVSGGEPIVDPTDMIELLRLARLGLRRERETCGTCAEWQTPCPSCAVAGNACMGHSRCQATMEHTCAHHHCWHWRGKEGE